MAVSERSFNLANWEEHPSDNRYIIFRFNKAPQAARFSEYLRKEGVDHEDHLEEGIHLFAVHTDDFEKARKLDYLVMAEHRQPMISNSILRWGLVLFVITAVTISLVGHCNKQQGGTGDINEVPLEKQKNVE